MNFSSTWMQMEEITGPCTVERIMEVWMQRMDECILKINPKAKTKKPLLKHIRFFKGTNSKLSAWSAFKNTLEDV